MEANYIIAHDVGTSGNKAVLVDLEGRVHATASMPYQTYYPRPNWAEQDPEDWWKATASTTRMLLEQTNTPPQAIAGVIHTTQLLGIVPISRDGQPLRRAIIWLDGRAPDQARRIMNRFLGRKIFAAIAGAELSGKDGLPKLLWLKENEPDVYTQMEYFLDVNGYLLYRATGRKVFEWSCASAFALDLKSKEWLRAIIRYIGLDLAKFPPLVRSIDQVGGLTAEAAQECGLLEGTPVFGGCGDAQAAAVGAGAVREGDGHVYLGTSGWVGVTTQKTPTGRKGVACIHSADPERILLFAETETAGVCLKWIAGQFYHHEQADPDIANVYALMDQAVESIPPGSDYLVFTPWLYGERCPFSDTYIRSAFFNISAEHSREHMLRAVYEGVAYNLRWILEIVEHTFGFPLPELRVVGGGARGEPWMQILADVTQRRVETVASPLEAGAVGAAMTAAVGLGVYPNFDALKSVIRIERSFEPRPETAEVYDLLYETFQALYRRLKPLYHRLNRQRSQDHTRE